MATKKIPMWKCTICGNTFFSEDAAKAHEKMENSWKKFLAETECIRLRHEYDVDPKGTKGILPKIYNIRFFYPDNTQVPDDTIARFLFIHNFSDFKSPPLLSQIQPGISAYLLLDKESKKVIGAFFWVSVPGYGGINDGGIVFDMGSVNPSSVSEFIRKKLLEKATKYKKGGKAFLKFINSK